MMPVRYHLAVALYRLGRSEEVRLELKQALDANQDFDGAADAKVLMSELSQQ